MGEEGEIVDAEGGAVVDAGPAPGGGQPAADRVFRIEMTGQNARSDLRSLETALLRFPEVQRHAVVRLVGPPPERGSIGGSTVETIKLVADLTFQTASLVTAIMQWRAAVRSTSAPTVQQDNHPPVPIPEGPADPTIVQDITSEIEGRE